MNLFIGIMVNIHTLITISIISTNCLIVEGTVYRFAVVVALSASASRNRTGTILVLVADILASNPIRVVHIEYVSLETFDTILSMTANIVIHVGTIPFN
jgi:hypothetical protein